MVSFGRSAAAVQSRMLDVGRLQAAEDTLRTMVSKNLALLQDVVAQRYTILVQHRSEYSEERRAKPQLRHKPPRSQQEPAIVAAVCTDVRSINHSSRSSSSKVASVTSLPEPGRCMGLVQRSRAARPRALTSRRLHDRNERRTSSEDCGVWHQPPVEIDTI